MKKFLLPENGNFYKANLHCHSTISDGRMTPEEIKEVYKEKGYSIVAYTDHELMIPHHELSDENFLAMTGYEVGVDKRINPGEPQTTCHICFVALSPDIDKHPFYNKEKNNYAWGNAAKLAPLYAKYDENEPDFIKTYSAECVSEMMRIGREKNFFVTYNHPTWSIQNAYDYLPYKGMHAMEIFNNSCLVNGYEDYNPRVYDDFLRSGTRLYCIGADDNHGTIDACGCYIKIKADKLEYNTIGKALLDGNFYASNGPEIYDLFVEDDKVVVTCSPAAKVTMMTGYRKAGIVRPDGDTPLTRAEFTLNPNQVYFRLTVTDKNGNHACTNAYFIDEL